MTLLLSVVVPTCNRLEDLARGLQSLGLAREEIDASAIECIVSDDGRRLSAESMVKAKFPWIRWTQGPARGPAANRNHGARQASGRWVAFLDDDCIADPAWLRILLQHGRF